MATLRDCGRLTEEVTLESGDVLTVRGLPARAFFELIAKYPQIQRFFGGADMDLGQLVIQLPDAVSIIIVAATGKMGDPEDIVAAEHLGVTDQLAIIQAAWKLSFPRGVKSFIDALVGSVNDLTSAVNSTRAVDTKLPEGFSSASATDTPMPGTTPQGSSQPGAS